MPYQCVEDNRVVKYVSIDQSALVRMLAGEQCATVVHGLPSDAQIHSVMPEADGRSVRLGFFVQKGISLRVVSRKTTKEVGEYYGKYWEIPEELRFINESLDDLHRQIREAVMSSEHSPDPKTPKETVPYVSDDESRKEKSKDCNESVTNQKHEHADRVYGKFIVPCAPNKIS